MKLLVNLSTAFISSIVLAISINVFLTPKGVDLSMWVFIYSLPVFLIIGVPVSFLIQWMTKKIKGDWKRFLTETLLFTLSGLGVGSVFVWTASLEKGDYQPILLIMTGSSLLYYFILKMMIYGRNLSDYLSVNKNEAQR